MKGSFFQKRGRWYWRGRLPGMGKITSLACKLANSRYATTDLNVAKCVVQMWFQEAQKDKHKPEFDGTIENLCLRFMAFADTYYLRSDGTPTKEPTTIRLALRLLREHYGEIQAAEFTPTRLKELRERMIDSGLCRREINRRVDIIKRMYKWAVAEELIPAFAYEALRAVSGLRRFRTRTIDHPPRKPARIQDVEAVLPFTTSVVAAMVRIQSLTGMRPDELCRMRPCDIDQTGDVWLYRPPHHKTVHHGHERIIPLGPRTQKILAPYLMRKPTEYCFSPYESEAERMRNIHEGCKPRKDLHDKYDTNSYYHAVKYAQKAARKAGVEFEPWTPYQLRHLVGTKTAHQFGYEAESLLLGNDIEVAKIYADKNLDMLIRLARMIG